MNGPRLGCRLIPQVASAFEGATDLENYRALLFFSFFFLLSRGGLSCSKFEFELEGRRLVIN